MSLFILKIAHIIICIILIAGVLLQSGKSAGLGAISGGSSSVFGDEGRQLDQILSKVTTVAAVSFMVLSLVIAYLQ
ncbi:MAG: preprotein translocase subunit SecG [Bacillota bacterium]